MHVRMNYMGYYETPNKGYPMKINIEDLKRKLYVPEVQTCNDIVSANTNRKKTEIFAFAGCIAGIGVGAALTLAALGKHTAEDVEEIS